ncbi:MAG: amino acid adenylation domain-containing protein [Acidobacteria bacterium]|nr:amino acid adenylation domain-containing protein [Acidobacteriota bacterium]
MNTTKANELIIFNEKTIEEKNYWIDKLSNKILPTNIRLDFPRPSVYTGKAGCVELNILGETWKKLSKLTGDEPFLIYAFLVAALSICLQKYTGNDSIVIGSPTFKTAGDISQQGNVLAIINRVNDSLSFKEFLVNVRKALLDDYGKQGYHFRQLINDLRIEDTGNKCPLFNIALVLKNIHDNMPEVMNDITITFTKETDQITGQVDFNLNLFTMETIERFCQHYLNILESALANIDIQVSGLQILTPGERHYLLVEWNNSKADYPRDKCVHQLFEDHAAQEPNAMALVYAGRKLTYKELDQQANQVAHYLEKLGVGADILVGICMERSVELVVSLLGVLKAGGAYVPLDPAYPKERLGSMLGDAEKLHILLTKEHLLNRLPETKIKMVCLDKDWETINCESTVRPVFRSTVHNLVYVIFTSGSTGKPKGAAVYHRGWTNLMNWFSREFQVNANDRVLVVTSFSFDITQRSLAMPLMNGAELHLLASEYYDPTLILQSIAACEITLMNCPPSMFYPLIETKDDNAYRKLQSLRILFLGGEAISASRLKPWVESRECRTEIANVYGAAECTDVSSFYRLKDFDRYIKTSVPAGKPIYNSQVYILDKNLNPVPMGATGEICLAGDGVGKGYINDEKLTIEKYVPNPFSTNDERLYRTGDLGRFLSDGNIEFIGRVDHQVKVRGFRVDLGDIETTLRQHDAVRESVVIDKEYSQGDQRLVAYLVTKIETPKFDHEKLINDLKIFLNDKLPNYMVPSIFVILEELPLNPNGKVDRGALPDPASVAVSKRANIEGPRTPLEENLVKVFSDFLKLEKLGIYDNFFDVGGHSLLATQIIARLNEIYKITLTQIDFLVNPTIAGLAERIEANR